MSQQTLHITNGDSCTDRLNSLKFSGTMLTWREILCEGPVHEVVFSKPFVDRRKNYLDANFTHDNNYADFLSQFDILSTKSFDEIILWFEYDLFCQVNLSALVSFLSQQHIDSAISLVTSGKIEGSDRLFGLSELTSEQLHQAHENRITLAKRDLETYQNFWKVYSSTNHNELIQLEIEHHRLPYLQPSIEAHLGRFPDKNSRLNQLEQNLLQAIKNNTFTSSRALLVHLLRNQGYYGFGDSQWEIIMDRMRPFFTENDVLQLSAEGKQLLEGKAVLHSKHEKAAWFGGCSKYDYLYDPEKQQLILR